MPFFLKFTPKGILLWQAFHKKCWLSRFSSTVCNPLGQTLNLILHLQLLLSSLIWSVYTLGWLNTVHSFLLAIPAYLLTPKELMGILLIACTSSSEKMCFKSPSFQPTEFWFNKSLTFWTVHPTGFADLSLPLSSPFSHLSSQMFILAPFPTSHLQPSFNNTFSPFQFCQSQESLDLFFSWKILELEKHLIFMTLDINKLGLVINFQTCFPNNAKLKTSNSLKPRPPYLP